MDPHRILKSYVYLNLIQRGLVGVVCGLWVIPVRWNYPQLCISLNKEIQNDKIKKKKYIMELE